MLEMKETHQVEILASTTLLQPVWSPLKCLDQVCFGLDLEVTILTVPQVARYETKTEAS